LITHIDADGVCRQGTDYTCGPAAAVTLLRRMGFEAEESELAVLCRTSAFLGTPADLLANNLQARYRAEGLTAEYRSFRSIAELENSGPTLALVKFSLFLDHYVAVLDVGPETVTIGDPLVGKTILSHEEFERRWRRVGVVLTSDSRCLTEHPARFRSVSKNRNLAPRVSFWRSTRSFEMREISAKT
jgi:predicted double-glycine peptidase